MYDFLSLLSLERNVGCIEIVQSQYDRLDGLRVISARQSLRVQMLHEMPVFLLRGCGMVSLQPHSELG